MRLQKVQDIDLNRLSGLFRERGHGILADGMVELLLNVLEGNTKGFSAFQCTCGELMVFDNKSADELARRLNVDVDNLPCRRCGGYKESMVDFELVDAVEEFIEVKGKDIKAIYEKNPIADFLPRSSEDEASIAFYAFIEALNSCFPRAMSNIQKEVRSIAESAYARNPTAFDHLVSSIVDFDQLSSKTRNYIKAAMISRGLKGEALRKKLFGESVDQRSHEEQVIRALHSAYLEAAEEAEHLDALENFRRISMGMDPMVNPFTGQFLPPVNARGNRRPVKSLAEKVEFIDMALPQLKIRSLYDNHLRNAKGHNEYEIDVDKKEITLERYNEQISFDKLRSMLDGITESFEAIDGFMLEKKIDKLRAKNLPGIISIILGYDVPELVGENLVPVGNSLPEIMVYQNWAFRSTDLSEMLDLSIHTDADGVSVRLTSNYEAKFKIKDVERWMKQVVISGEAKIEVFTTYAPLPVFLPKTTYLVPFGLRFRSQAYITLSTAITVKLGDELLEEISKSINFRKDSAEALELTEEARRLRVVVKSGLAEETIKRSIELRRSGFDAKIVPAQWTRLVSFSRSGIPKAVRYIIPKYSFQNAISSIKKIAGGDTTISYRVEEGLVIAVIEILESSTRSAIVFPLHFGSAYLQELMNQESIEIEFDDSPDMGHGIMLSLALPHWQASLPL